MSTNSEHQMSRRARVYITAGGTRHFLIGLTMVAFPWLYSSAAFIPIFNLVNAQVWAWLMVMVGGVCISGAAARHSEVARAGMVGSAVVTAVLAVGLSMGVANIWIGFAQHVGPDTFADLVRNRPGSFPAALLASRIIAPPSPFLPLIMLSVAVKDFCMCAQPLQVPLEDYPAVRRVRTRRI